jgi:uncharacterized protein YkwD
VALLATLLGPLVRAQPAMADVTFEQKMLELINQERQNAGIAPVQAAPVLNTIAGPGPTVGCLAAVGGRANDMGVRNYFSHSILGCGSTSVFDLLSAVSGLVYSAAGENIAWMNGTTDPLVAAQNLMSSLMNSPDHRANILDPKYTAVGIGSWTTAAGQTWSGGGTALTRVWITSQVFAQMPLTSTPPTGVCNSTGPSVAATAVHHPVNDFDGNGTTDVAIFRPAEGSWYLRTPTPSVVTWGQSGDIAVPGDYNGDHITDIAVFRPSNNSWYIRTPTPLFVQWGEPGDIPVPGDYDGNGTTDVAVFRPSTGTWYMRTATPTSVVWGQSGDIPVPGDYDGNGTTDIAVFRPSTGAWYLHTPTPQVVTCGQSGDVPTPGDYDGNGTTDIAIFRPSTGTWYLRTANSTSVVWGQSGDVPTPGDYDGNGTTDIAVFRPSNSAWYLHTATPQFVQWGQSGDKALSLPDAIRRFF